MIITKELLNVVDVLSKNDGLTSDILKIAKEDSCTQSEDIITKVIGTLANKGYRITHENDDLTNKMDELSFVSEMFNHHSIDMLTASELENVNFSVTNKAHDWKNHVSTFIAKNWHRLTYFEKCIVYVGAKLDANMEEWE